MGGEGVAQAILGGVERDPTHEQLRAFREEAGSRHARGHELGIDLSASGDGDGVPLRPTEVPSGPAQQQSSPSLSHR